ncbi:hypothetical protein DL95DRAFT_41774 [Leptodontidium sp. 2 PMI_412]|nr:hypothetical protein DL95DRAFT_41774 [Leptodontidium sp. 2 PMI_412]
MTNSQLPQWTFPLPSNDSDTLIPIAKFGPVYWRDSVKLEWVPPIEITPPKNIAFACNNDNVDWIDYKTNLSSGYLWPMTATYDHDYISCWFCIWDIGGNTVSFEYVSSNPKRSAIMWSSSSPSFTSTLLPTDTATASAKSGLSASDKIALGTGIGIGLPSCLAGLVGCAVAIIAIRRRHSRKSKAGPSQDRIHLENMRPNQNS